MTALAKHAQQESRLSDAELAALLDYCTGTAEAPAEDPFFRTVVGRMKDVAFKCDSRGRWHTLNPAWEKMTGFTVAECLGRCFLDFVHPEDVVECLGLFRSLIARKTNTISCELRHLTRTGEYKWVELEAYVLPDRDGIPEGLAGTLANISDRRQAAEALGASEARRQATVMDSLAREKEMDQVRSQFVSMASHELRTPLSTLTLGLDFLSQYWSRLSPEVLEQNLANVMEGTRRLNRILDELPLLGRSEDGRLNCKPEETNIAELLESLAGESHQNLSDRKRIKICCEPPNLHAAIDPQMLTHIVLNLISNACKYSDESHPVLFTAAASSDGLELCVKDSGEGIPEEDQKRIQNLLSKDPHPEAESSFTGLGLMIVRRCVEAHNGSIVFVSTPGKGSCFTVTLPVKTLVH